MDEPETMRIVLLGKTGSGKSSLANTLFGGQNTFKVNHSPKSETKLCVSDITTINGRKFKLVDTPGFFDTDPKSTELTEELLNCIVKCAPGPHAFLFVLKIEKYTLLEQATVALMVKYFSPEVLNYTTLVFTRGDDLPEEMKIEEWVNDHDDLKNLVEKCGGRCHVVDNKYWDNSQDPYRNNQYQIQELLKSIDKTVEENGGYYTNYMLQQVKDKIEDEAKKIEESSPGKFSLKNRVQKATDNVLGFLKRHKSLIIGVLLGAFIGGLVAAGIAIVIGLCTTTTAVVTMGAMGGAAVVGGMGKVMGAAMVGAMGKAVGAAVGKAAVGAVAGLGKAVGGASVVVGAAGGAAGGAVGGAAGAEEGGAAGGAVAVGGATGSSEEKQGLMVMLSQDNQIKHYVDDAVMLYEQLKHMKMQYLI